MPRSNHDDSDNDGIEFDNAGNGPLFCELCPKVSLCAVLILTIVYVAWLANVEGSYKTSVVEMVQSSNLTLSPD